MNYQPLESSSLNALGVSAPSFTGTTETFLSTSTFIYSFFLVIIVGAAFYRYVIAGIYRIEASETTIRKSNEIVKKVTLGLLGVFSLFLILFTVNKGLVTGEIGLDALGTIMGGKGSGVIATPVVVNQGGGTTVTPVSRSCTSVDAVKASLTSSSGICGNTSCTVLSGCNYQQYLPIIERETNGDTQLKKMIIVTMCKESRGRESAQNRNTNGTFDCGLMQINKSSCDQTILAPDANIREGVRLMKQKISAVQRYPVIQNVPVTGNIFASYNCCANGTIPAAPSADCTPANGFPANFPKWACPLNPGEGTFNMCAVKSYACELTACLNQL